ncbi:MULTISPECIES: nuclear transport factor 2 family protein [Nostocales]|uniref:Steroid delta-isomerase n=2 Tax=Nostocales TaxID=1161 RepID=A0A0C1QYY5_9CYAN|nr:nuclear transport factor 2 family protein [Tolypothrix bouteillei]KAF3886713.1 steroid delta-isomerase [Tolypothrix bouteillei VB521301]
MTDKSIIEVVDKQLKAYNERNLEEFLSCYIDNVPVLAFPSQKEILEISGKAFANRYKKLFENSPNLHCQLISRCIEGNIAIDQELVTGFNGLETKTAVAIYQIENGKITKVWFVKDI